MTDKMTISAFSVAIAAVVIVAAAMILNFVIVSTNKSKETTWSPVWPAVEKIGHYYGTEWREVPPAHFEEYPVAQARVYLCPFPKEQDFGNLTYNCAMQVVVRTVDGQRTLISNGPAQIWTQVERKISMERRVLDRILRGDEINSTTDYKAPYYPSPSELMLHDTPRPLDPNSLDLLLQDTGEHQ